jgi:hypothetical protein
MLILFSEVFMTVLIAKSNLYSINLGTEELTNTIGNLYASAAAAGTAFVNMSVLASQKYKEATYLTSIDKEERLLRPIRSTTVRVI